MKNIAVVGGAGYIGSHICKELHKCGYNPIVFDDFSTGHQSAVLWGGTRKTDITKDVLNFEGIDAVIHCAAIATVSESIADPIRCYDVNICGTINIVKAMKKYGVDKIIFSSTCAFDEDTPYGKSKKIAESIIRISGVRYTILRYYNVAGADPDCEIGEMHNPETHLIPLAIEAAISGKVLNVYNEGNDLRDYIHVSDVARANIAALNLLEGGEKSFIEEVGTGIATSTLDILHTVIKITGKNIASHFSYDRSNEPSRLVATTPCVYGLRSIDDIITTAYNWYKKVNA